MAYRKYLVAGALGALVTLIAMGALLYNLHERGIVDAALRPCSWRIRVLDTKGMPIRDVEVIVMDTRKWRAWHKVGNWTGRGSLTTDSEGKVDFLLKGRFGYGGEFSRVLGYESRTVPYPALAVRSGNRWIPVVELGASVARGEVEVVLDQP